MKLAFIADIHSNIHAFQGVLKKIDDLSVDEIICCGDIVGYYAFPTECINLMKDNNISSVMGNHDLATVDNKTSWFRDNSVEGIKFSRKKVDKDNIKYLATLPYKMLFNRDGISFYIAHGSPRDNLFEYVHPVVSDDFLQTLGKNVAADVIILGHTHVQMEAEVDTQLFLNPGSVGQPRDGISKACFMVFNTNDRSMNWYRVSYDLDAVCKSVLDNNLPLDFADRLRLGK